MGSKIMAKFIIFLDRLVNFYLYYVVMACFLSLVPYINPDYPLFNFIFKSAGFYLIPPIFGVSFSPMFVLALLVLCSIGLHKIYDKYYAPKTNEQPQVIVMTAEEFMEKFGNKNNENEENK